MALFTSMIHRMYTVPLNEENFEKEKGYVLSTAKMKERQLKRRELMHLSVPQKNLENRSRCPYIFSRVTRRIEKQEAAVNTKTGFAKRLLVTRERVRLQNRSSGMRLGLRHTNKKTSGS